MRDRRKAPGQLLRGIGRAAEVPQVFDLVRVEPGLDVAEQAIADLQSRLQAAHEGEDSGAVSPARLFIGVEAQPEVVVTPDAYGLYFSEQVNRLLHALAGLEHVAQDHEAVGPVLPQHGDGLAEFPRLLMDVGQ
jgi:hypothetical protein